MEHNTAADSAVGEENHIVSIFRNGAGRRRLDNQDLEESPGPEASDET